MGKSLFIAEKPSVVDEFAKVLGVSGNRADGYLESGDKIVTWCLGHLITMSYPDAYDPLLRKWTMESLPFLPKEFKYEVIDSSKKQYNIIKKLLNRKDVDTIYVCTDSGREGEYIYRLVEQMTGVKGKKRLRVWIDSQTEEEIKRGIREAKDLSEYDDLAASAYLRAIEDYLMGINFSRVMTLKYGNAVADYLGMRNAPISIGRVMTCVLGMVVRREREIRSFVKTPFYRLTASFCVPGEEDSMIEAEWKAVRGSKYFESPLLYRENGFKEKKDAEDLRKFLSEKPMEGTVYAVDKKKETKNPPLLYNLAELQNDCSKMFKISPDETLKIVQELYEKKMVTYPRTDARVLSSAVAKEITKNIGGLKGYAPVSEFAGEVLANGSYKGLINTRYVNDSQITDHYAIIPTGQGAGNAERLSSLAGNVYEVIARRFLSIFFPPAIYQKYSIQIEKQGEYFFANYKVLTDEGYLKVSKPHSGADADARGTADPGKAAKSSPDKDEETEIIPQEGGDAAKLTGILSGLKKGKKLDLAKLSVKEGETSPPKRYTSGSMILAMENAGQLIEDEELRAQIKGSGIGTSATRADILTKLVKNGYLALSKKTQVITPTLMGEMIYDVCELSMKPMLNPELTASWEKGLTGVAEGTVTPAEYMEKLEGFVTRRTNAVKTSPGVTGELKASFDNDALYYKKNTYSGSGVRTYKKRYSGSGAKANYKKKQK